MPNKIRTEFFPVWFVLEFVCGPFACLASIALNRHPLSKACLQHDQTVIQPCMWFMEEPSQFSQWAKQHIAKPFPL